MPIVVAADTWSFLSDPMEDSLEPWSPSWFPILENEAGYYVVFESGEDNHRCLIGYWHDDASRRIIHSSLPDRAMTVIDAASHH